MKLIHLADLHIGKRVNDFSMIEDQAYILAEILDITREETAEAVIIAGDVYDRTIPSVEAVRLFDHFLTALAELRVPVLMISGNHDSAERIAFGAELLEVSGVYVSPLFDGTLTPVTLTDAWGPVDFYLLPFLKPAMVRRFFPEAEIESYHDAIKAVMEKLTLIPNRRKVLVAHQFVTGAETAGSEELSIGGLEQVGAELFTDFDYVALGHIHRAQAVKKARIRYGGTPLKYSFSEANHQKVVTIAELEADGAVRIRLRPLTPRRDLREVKGDFEQIMAAPKSEDYLHITLTDEEEIPDILSKIRTKFPHVMRLDYDNIRTRALGKVERAEAVESKSELTLFSELYQQQNGQSMSEEQCRFMEQLIETLKEENK